jgi:Tol biopolymer transport system component
MPKTAMTISEAGLHLKHICQIAMVMAIVLLVSLLLPSLSALGQVPALPSTDNETGAARARQIAERFEAEARVLTVFDREGKALSTIGEPAIYYSPVFSPDQKQLAVVKRDLESDTVDLWALEVATGKTIRITSSRPREGVHSPAWSSDGSQVVYVALRGGYWGLYRKASNGEGPEEHLYQHPGAGIGDTDWSLDGRLLLFHSTDLSSGTLRALPLGDDGARSPNIVLRHESQLYWPRLSPDSRFLSYMSHQSGRNEVYVRPFDASAGSIGSPAAEPWQVSEHGIRPTPAFWRRDGKELLYVAADGAVMALEFSAGPGFPFGKPTLLFRLSEAVPVNNDFALFGVSPDGQRIVIAVPHAPTLAQISILDRQGTVLNQAGELGRYLNPALSPDGTRVAVMRVDPREGDLDIWTFDVATGDGTPVTTGTLFESSPVWSPDGREVAYASTSGIFSSIYRKAWDGTGNEEQLFQFTPGAGLWVTDWSSDGHFLTFHDSSDGVLHVLPLGGDQNPLEREAIEWLRDEYNVAQARFSPDSRFLAYMSNEIEAEILEVYVRPFDPTKSNVSVGGEKPVQVSTAGALGMISWRQDGKELYYLTPDWEVMAVDVTTNPFQAGTPRLLFRLPGPLVGNPKQWNNISADGQRFVFVLDVPVSVSAR